jgi:hypothetical protein
MKRAGMFFIAIAAAVTMACGGSESGGASSSPTGPSSSPGSTPPPQQSCSPPSAPANLSVASIAGTSVTLTWSPVSSATEYLILVGTTPSSSNTLLTNATNTRYTWTVSPGTYFARIQAKNLCSPTNTSGSSNEVSFTVAG